MPESPEHPESQDWMGPMESQEMTVKMPRKDQTVNRENVVKKEKPVLKDRKVKKGHAEKTVKMENKVLPVLLA